MDPLAHAWRWKRWTATGPEDAISSIFTNLDANLPNGWRRLTGDELLPFGSLVRPESGWYGRKPDHACGSLALSIERPVPNQLSGGWVRTADRHCIHESNGLLVAGEVGRFQDEGAIPRGETWHEVGRFLDEGIIPAARAAGVNIRVPPPEEMFFSELPFEVGDRLRRFSDAACKSLPLEADEAELWRDFVISVFRMKARFQTDPFINWLSAVGWPREAAAELYSHLLDDCLLLSRYADEVSAA